MEDDIEPSKWYFKITKNRDGKENIQYANKYEEDYISYPKTQEGALKEGWDYVERKELELKKQHEKLERKEAAIKAKEEALKAEAIKIKEQSEALEALIKKLETKQDAQDKKDFEQNSPLADLIG